MVSKNAAGSVKSVSKKPAAKKVSLKSKSKKVSSKSLGTKAPAKRILDAQVPVKADVNPVNEVLEIKAHNAEKKAAKGAKTQKVSVKQNAPKVAAKSTSSSKGGLWAAFINGYKNIFNFSGRTSRYEFWAFMLSNLIVCLIALPLLLWASAMMYKSEMVMSGILIFVLLVEVLVFLSLTVRRLHDTGVSAWDRYFRPVVMSFLATVLMVVLAVVIVSVVGPEALQTTPWQIVSFFYGLLFIAIMLALMYYTTKISVVSSYYEGDKAGNIYGAAEFNNDYYKAKGLQYTVLCLTIVSFFYMVVSATSGYFGGFKG